VLHHPFDLPTLTQQMRDELCTALIVPDAVAFPLAATGSFAEAHPASIIAAWRAPERLATSPAWSVSGVALIDVALFGEVALVPARRRADSGPSPMPLGPLLAPRDAADGIVVAEVSRTEAGTIAVRGPMVPQHAFPPGIEESGLPHIKISERGLVDTGYTCRFDADKKALVVTGPPAGMIRVGGYRFPLQDLRGTRRRHRSRGEAWRAAARGHRPAALRVGGRPRRHASGAACGRCQSIDRRRLRKRSGLTLQNIADWPIALTARSRVWA
jgi:hypothetical protein